ncbi:hypothetical protein FKP32DRAFT_1121236 [Trametes sanguinea]|nr:hypothetical protein FKP32DRAFT_1121236 [Trametes sanguinea]
MHFTSMLLSSTSNSPVHNWKTSCQQIRHPQKARRRRSSSRLSDGGSFIACASIYILAIYARGVIVFDPP